MSKMADGNGKESELLGKFVEKQTKYGTATRLVAKSPLLVKHRVCQSDTLMGIALKYGSTVEKIKRENKLWTNDSLFLREHLLIPITSENAKEIPKDSEIIESDHISKSRSTSSGKKSNSQIVESEPADSESIDSNQNKADTTESAMEKDFLSKFDHSFAVLKSNVKKMEQNTSFSADLHNSSTHLPQTSNASHNIVDQSCDGYQNSGYELSEDSPVLRIKSRTQKVQSSISCKLEQTNDELFQL